MAQVIGYLQGGALLSGTNESAAPLPVGYNRLPEFDGVGAEAVPVLAETSPGGGVVFDPTVGEAITGIAGVRASSRVESGAQGWTLLDLWTGITSTDAAVRLRGDQYEFSGTLSGAITTGKKLATLPLGLPKPRASAVPCVASSGVVGITVKEDGSVFAGTIGAETTWVVLDALTSRLGQSETRPSLIIPTLPVIRLELGGITLLPPAADTYFPGTISVEPNGFDIPGTAGPVAVTVSGHGNSTWGSTPKKSMRLKFSSATSVMGFPAEKTYRLLANYFDQTFVRNGMAFEIARRTFNMWTPKVAMCEVFVDGVYQGVYQLAEPVKASANRLQITPSKTATDAASGTYMLEVNQRMETQGKIGARTVPSNVPVQFEEPEDPDAAQQAYMSAHMNAFDAALMGGNFRDPELGYAKYVDMRSWADWILVSEVTCNSDSNLYSSVKLYKLPDVGAVKGKLFLGPLWDSDLSMSNGYHSATDTFRDWVKPAREWHTRKGVWFYRMMEDPAFQAVMLERWTVLYAALRGKDGIVAWGERLSASLSVAATHDAEKWSRAGDSYERFKSAVRWFSSRVEWLNARMPYLVANNLITNPRPQTVTTGYGVIAAGGGAAALTLEAGNALGGNALRSTFSVAATTLSGIYYSNCPLVAGKTYTLLAVIRTSKDHVVQAVAEKKNSASTTLSSPRTIETVVQAGVMKALPPLVFVAEDGVVKANLTVVGAAPGPAWAIGDWFEVCGLLVTEGAYPDLQYADPGTTGTWKWDGVAYASPSKGWPL